MAASYGQFCGLARALDVVGERWTLLIVRELLTGPQRFSALRRAFPGLASNLLSERLAGLATNGLVERDAHPDRKAVEYRLSPLGLALREPVVALMRWSVPLMAEGPAPGDRSAPSSLGLALEALVGGRPAGHGTVHVEADGAEFDILAAPDGARIAPATGGRHVDTVVQGPTPLVLGLFSGTVSRIAFTSAGGRIAGRTELVDALLATAPAGAPG